MYNQALAGVQELNVCTVDRVECGNTAYFLECNRSIDYYSEECKKSLH